MSERTHGYQCTGCRAPWRTVKWKGPCPDCGRVYNIISKYLSDNDDEEDLTIADGVAVPLSDVKVKDIPRISTGVTGLDKILGGTPTDANGSGSEGLVPGSVVLLCGPPGSGKSTLLTMAFRNIAQKRLPVLYVSGEEPLADIKRRAERLGKVPRHFQVLTETDLDTILEQADQIRPKVIVIDSIQTVDSDEDLLPGSSSAIEAGINELRRYAQSERIAIIVIAHVTKDGSISGPRRLEHMVDASFYFEPGQFKDHRWLRCLGKNRYGRAPASTRFEMGEGVLKDCYEEDEQKQETEAV